MAEYESRPRTSTARALAAGVPPVATPLGALLFDLGCGVAFRDWYISEGGREGPRKLQGLPRDERVSTRAPAASRQSPRSTPSSTPRARPASCGR